MSEIICPHCGSSNPIEADNCSVCHKSLYEEPSQPFHPAADNGLEWLKDYRSFGSDNSFLSEDTSGIEDDEDLGSPETRPEAEDRTETGTSFEEQSTEKPHQDKETDIPEWLARIRARTREDGINTAPESPPAGEEPKYKVGEPIKTDWLKDLTGTEEKPKAEDETSNYPDWLKRISARRQEAMKAREDEETSQVAPTDSAGETSEPVASSLPEPESPISPFLQPQETVEAEVEPTPAAESEPDLFNLYSQELETLAPPSAESGELTETGPFETPPDLIPPETESPKPFEELPAFITQGLPEEPVSREIEPLDEIEPIPDIDWLDKSYIETPQPPAEGVMDKGGIDWASEESEERPEPAWDALANLERLRAESRETTEFSEDALANLERLRAEDEEEIDFSEDALANLAGLNPDTREPVEEDDDGLADLDWLKAQREESAEPFSEAPSVPDWLSSAKEEPTEPFMSHEAEIPLQPGELPEWLFDQEGISAQKESLPGSYETLPSANLEPTEESSLYPEQSWPDWLKEATPELPPAEPAASGSGKTDMPDWLQDLTPAAAGSSTPTFAADEHIEESGPLAGFQGILPGGETVAHYTKPPAYSGMLQVTEKQRIYATMFDTLISREKQVQGSVVEKSTAASQALRLFVGILMIGILVIALFFDAHIAAPPALYPGENVAFFNSIQSITTTTASSRILVGMDYEPSLSGEVGTAAASVLQDLMTGNSSLAFVSLNPTGPALAEDLAARSAKSVPEYRLDEKVVHLGYLPGGAAALAGLAASPKVAAPLSIHGTSAWESGPMQGVSSIQDFDAVLLLTDNSESARAWIEQVQTAAGDTPFLLVSSAQVAPALQPYVHSGQVTGMLNGLSGAAAYQQLAQDSSGDLPAYWDAYQVGLLLAALFMILGAAVFSAIKVFGKFKKA